VKNSWFMSNAALPLRLYLIAVLAIVGVCDFAARATAGSSLDFSTLPQNALPSLALISTSPAKSRILSTVPVEKLSRFAVTSTPGGARVIAFVLTKEAGLKIAIKCRGCPGNERVARGIHSSRQMIGEFLPNRAVLIITATHPKENGRYFEFLDAGGRNPHRRKPELCLLPRSVTPMACKLIEDKERLEQRGVEKREAEAKKAREEAAARAKAAEEAAKQKAEREAREGVERAAKEGQEAQERQESREKSEQEAIEKVTKEKAAREAKERETKEKEELEARERKEAKERQEAQEKAEKERVERERKENEIITSVDNTKGDLAPYEGVFNIAWQKFKATSNLITYAGITIGNPRIPVGKTPAYEAIIRICTTQDCTGLESELGKIEAEVNNYGLTTGEFTTPVAVTPGQVYYLVWTPPVDVEGVKWLAFWDGGKPTPVESSQEMEAVVRGYNSGSGGSKREIIDYLGTHAPPAPYSGPFIYAYQNFTAVSNRITQLGVVLGNPSEIRGRIVPRKVDIRLCDTPKCSDGPLAHVEREIVNYGITEGAVEPVEVIPGKAYYVNWESPEEYKGAPWVTYWLGRGPRPEEAESMQAFARGFDAGALTYNPVYFRESTEGISVSTFRDYEAAGEEGVEIGAFQSVEVGCKVFAPEIASIEPEGFWYRIHSSPWSDEYYAAANAFLNGANFGEAIYTDTAVPDC
jgi:hypothetical protein